MSRSILALLAAVAACGGGPHAATPTPTPAPPPIADVEPAPPTTAPAPPVPSGPTEGTVTHTPWQVGDEVRFEKYVVFVDRDDRARQSDDLGFTLQVTATTPVLRGKLAFASSGRDCTIALEPGKTVATSRCGGLRGWESTFDARRALLPATEGRFTVGQAAPAIAAAVTRLFDDHVRSATATVTAIDDHGAVHVAIEAAIDGELAPMVMVEADAVKGELVTGPDAVVLNLRGEGHLAAGGIVEASDDAGTVELGYSYARTSH